MFVCFAALFCPSTDAYEHEIELALLRVFGEKARRGWVVRSAAGV